MPGTLYQMDAFMRVQVLVCIWSTAPGLRKVPQSAVPEMKQAGTSIERPAKNSISERLGQPAVGGDDGW